MKKMCVMLAMVICLGFTGCKKSTPAEPKSAAPAVDLTSAIDKLKEQAKSMNVDELKEMAEKYKAQYLSTESKLNSTNEILSKLIEAKKFGPEIEGLGKDVENLKAKLSSIKERLAVYVDALKAQGVDINSFTLE